MRIAAACLLALIALLFLRSSDTTRADDLLDITTSVNYNVRADEGDVLVTWDLSVTSTDTAFFYDGLTLPILAGATELTSQSDTGVALTTDIVSTEVDYLERAEVTFDRALSAGGTYEFSMSYTLPETRGETLLVTPFYVFVPLLTLGDEAEVTVTTPQDPAWSVSLEPDECDLEAGALRCSGSEAGYLAGLLEVSRPDATTTVDFDAPVGDQSVGVSITFFQGEDAVAAHQRDVITTTLSLIAEAYGLAYAGPPAITVEHGGRQSVLGYGGLTSCEEQRCGIVISPGASDYTLVHELAHLWSGIFEARWLSEGFAEWVTERVASRSPSGLLEGDPGPPPSATVPLQLDEWEPEGSLIGASDESIATTQAGYDYSLRFIQALSGEVGEETLREVNRAIAESAVPADSRRYMDVMEEVSGINPDALFLLWVFPDSTRPLIEERREARDRYQEAADQLTAEGLSEEALKDARESILDWRFADALAALDQVESEIGRYFELQDELDDLKTDADALGLVVPGTIGAAIMRWDFAAADDLLASARSALGAYGVARERVAEPRNVWERFGLLGDDPNDELKGAREAFESGSFERSLERSARAVDMVDDASGAAMRRLLVVAGIFGAVAGAIGVAYWVALLRRRRLGEI